MSSRFFAAVIFWSAVFSGFVSATENRVQIMNLFWETRVLAEKITGQNDELAKEIFDSLQMQLSEELSKASDNFNNETEYQDFLKCLLSEAGNHGNTSEENLSYWREQLFVKLPAVDDGDIIFHESLSAQSAFIKKATHSSYTHCGVIAKVDGNPYVFEASSTVKYSSLASFIDRGKNKKYVIKRLYSWNGFDAAQKKKLYQAAMQFKGKSYDSLFLWSDSKIYCSELVFKIFRNGLGIEIGTVEKFRDMDFSDPDVKAELIRRFGSMENVPMQESIITPVAVFNSWKLYTSASN